MTFHLFRAALVAVVFILFTLGVKGAELGTADITADEYKKLTAMYPQAVMRLPSQAESHEESEVLDAIKALKFAPIGKQKFETARPNADKAFEGGGNHREATYYVFAVKSEKGGEAFMNIKAAPYNTVKMWLNAESLLEGHGGGDSGINSNYLTKCTLKKGVNIFVIKYINTWSSRWIKWSIAAPGATILPPQ